MTDIKPRIVQVEPFGIEVAIFESRDDMEQYYKDEFDEDIGGKVNAVRHAALATVIADDDDAQYFNMVLPPKVKTSTIVHECSHIVDFIMAHVGIPIDVENTEVRAHLLGKLFEDTYKALGERDNPAVYVSGNNSPIGKVAAKVIQSTVEEYAAAFDDSVSNAVEGASDIDDCEPKFDLGDIVDVSITEWKGEITARGTFDGENAYQVAVNGVDRWPWCCEDRLTLSKKLASPLGGKVLKFAVGDVVGVSGTYLRGSVVEVKGCDDSPNDYKIDWESVDGYKRDTSWVFEERLTLAKQSTPSDDPKKFKVGDKVTILDDDDLYFVGQGFARHGLERPQFGEVVESSGGRAHVKFTSEGNAPTRVGMWFELSDLQHFSDFDELRHACMGRLG